MRGSGNTGRTNIMKREKIDNIISEAIDVFWEFIYNEIPPDVNPIQSPKITDTIAFRNACNKAVDDYMSLNVMEEKLTTKAMLIEMLKDVPDDGVVYFATGNTKNKSKVYLASFPVRNDEEFPFMIKLEPNEED